MVSEFAAEPLSRTELLNLVWPAMSLICVRSPVTSWFRKERSLS
jgi:hypothetical protein